MKVPELGLTKRDVPATITTTDMGLIVAEPSRVWPCPQQGWNDHNKGQFENSKGFQFSQEKLVPWKNDVTKLVLRAAPIEKGAGFDVGERWQMKTRTTRDIEDVGVAAFVASSIDGQTDRPK